MSWKDGDMVKIERTVPKTKIPLYYTGRVVHDNDVAITIIDKFGEKKQFPHCQCVVEEVN